VNATEAVEADVSEQAAAQLSALYNPFDPGFLADPHPAFERLHEEAPVCYSDLFESWLITRYRDVAGALDQDVLRARSGTMGPRPADEVAAEMAKGCPQTHVLYDSDGPTHARLRALIDAAFSPRVVASLEPMARRAASELVDAIASGDAAELVNDIVVPFADRTILDFVGVPQDDHAQVRAWNYDSMTMLIPGKDLAAQIAAARAMVAYQRYSLDLIAARRADPRDDIATALVEARADGMEPLSDAEIVWELMELTGVASNTKFGLANVLARLLREPGRWDALRADPGLVPAAVEEALRVESPILGCAREARETLEIAGATIPSGAPVLVAYAAANHDPDEFAEPERFDPTRPNADHGLSMGRGTHSCVGAAVARMQMRVAIQILGERLPGLRLENGFQPTHTAPFPFLRTVTELPVRWHPRRA
jgi:cytochrome P450